MFYKSNTSAWKESPGRNHRYIGLYNDYGPDLFYLFVLSMVCGGKVPVVLGRQKADEHHQDCAQYHGGIPGEPAVKAYIAHGPGNRGRGIHMLAQDIRGDWPASISLRIPPPTPVRTPRKMERK